MKQPFSTELPRALAAHVKPHPPYLLATLQLFSKVHLKV